MLDRLDWTDLSEDAARDVAATALFSGDREVLESFTVTGRTAGMPFYESVLLAHVVLTPNEEGSPQNLFLLLGNKTRHYFVLDGTSPPVHAVNAGEGVQITPETVPDYLRFFSFAVRGDQGPFLLFEKPATGPADDEPEEVAAVRAAARPLELQGRDAQERFLLRGAVRYGADLFDCRFAVGEDGTVEMLEDEQLASEVPDELFAKLPELRRPVLIAASIREKAAPARLQGGEILRMLVELLLEQALEAESEDRILSHFNARLPERAPLDRFAKFVATASPVVAIESTLPFVEETVAAVVKSRVPARSPRWIHAEPDSSDETRLRIRVPDEGPGLVLLPFHSYRGVADVERVAHEIASRDLACLIGCERVRDLPDSLRSVIDLTLCLPRLDPALFETLFRRVTGSDAPEGWQEEDTHWVTHVHHSDFQHPLGLDMSPADTLAYLRERAQVRLRSIEPVEGLRLRDLHGLGEARAFAEDLITDIHEALAGRLDWRHVDRGVLLVGAPGTGKTTLARAIAKDCGVRFINASAASWQAAGYLGDHIRALRADFALARRFAPAILFIDEIDSIGNREEFTGHNAQYSTQVVNALLEQLQGMDPSAPVIVIAATNHRNRVDPALRRAGRLDREIEIPRPNTEALSQIYQHYLSEYAPEELAPDIQVRDLGGLSLGKTGADIELFVRGAARRARKAGRTIRQADLLDEITSKPRDPGSSPRLTPEELRRVAVHEAGHALASYLTGSQGEQLGFVSIVPRMDGTLGFVASRASNRFLLTRAEYLERLEVILGGRAAEEVVYGEESISGGAGGSGRDNDLAAATQGALQLVTQFGLGPEQSLLWSAAPDASQLRQAEEILRECYKAALTKLWQHKDTLERLTDALVEHQELTGDEIRRLMAGPRARPGGS